jgi:hypothetical protein
VSTTPLWESVVCIVFHTNGDLIGPEGFCDGGRKSRGQQFIDFLIVISYSGHVLIIGS